MWSKLVLVLLLTNLLDLSVSDDPAPAASNATETPAGGGNGTMKGDSKMCMMPMEMLKETDKQTQVLDVFNKMRDELPLLKPKTKGACPLKKIAWDDKLMESATKAAMMCPMPTSGPKHVTYTNHKDDGGYGETVVFAMSNDTMVLTDEMMWKTTLMTVSDEEMDGLITSYKFGEWDSIFQVLWTGTTTVGCSMTVYNASDMEKMTGMFQMPDMVMPVTLVNLVCHFSPPGPPSGGKSWEMCDAGSGTPGEGSSPNPDGDDHAQTTASNDDVNPTPGADSDKKSTAARVRAKVGFNFEAVAITSVLVLSFKSST